MNLEIISVSTRVARKMHCPSPNCFDDSCQGECCKENEVSEAKEEAEEIYCED